VHVRRAFLVTILILLVLLSGMVQLMQVFSAAPILLIITLPFLNMILLSATCPRCNKPIYGQLHLYSALLNGKCNACNKS
jgi:uncharacterized membrane protein YccC